MAASLQQPQQRKCIVPNCLNTTTTGIPFPEQKDLQQKWLVSLGIQDFQPTPESFVCLDHFGGNDDLLTNVNGDENLENTLEELPIPVPTVVSAPQANDVQKTEVKTETPEETYSAMEALLDDEDDDVEFTINQLLKLNTSNCRLCGGHDLMTKDVFNKFDDSTSTIAAAITQCIPEIKISKYDKKSHVVCNKCLIKIRSYKQFRSVCLENDKKQNPKVSQKHKLPHKSPVASKKAKFSSKKTEMEEIEVELRKAIEGKLTAEMKDAENIIIQIQSDEESETHQKDLAKIKLPKDIKIKSVSKMQTEAPPKIIYGIDETEFCLNDGYLFEFKITKGTVKNVKCLEPDCPSLGFIEVVQNDTDTQEENSFHVTITEAHNHFPPSETDMKKLLFIHAMCRRTQADKAVNFRHVYDKMCKEYPEMKELIPLKTVINHICANQIKDKVPPVASFQDFYEIIEDDQSSKLHFTTSSKQFYQEKITASDGSQCVIFANRETVDMLSDGKIMYVDASFRTKTNDDFDFQLVSFLVWVSESFYPLAFALVSDGSQEIYRELFTYLHDNLAPKLRPDEIVTDYEAALYYSLGEVYSESHIGGSVFYYTQNIYTKLCTLKMSHQLETDSCFRNIYHMILMLPLLPVNTVLDGLRNIEQQASQMGLMKTMAPLFEYVRDEWVEKVTPELFCVHRLENRINENVIAPFKKLRDLLMLSRGKSQKQRICIVTVVEKLIELEAFLATMYSVPSKKSFARDLSSTQKRSVIRAWEFIEKHPKININSFFNKVWGYIKCMENQLWIWGFYRFDGEYEAELINASNFSIISTAVAAEDSEDDEIVQETDFNPDHADYIYPCQNDEETTVMDVVIEQNGDGFIVQKTEPADLQEGLFLTDNEDENKDE